MTRREPEYLRARVVFAIHVNDFPIHPSVKVVLIANDTLLYAIAKSNISNKLQKQLNGVYNPG